MRIGLARRGEAGEPRRGGQEAAGARRRSEEVGGGGRLFLRITSLSGREGPLAASPKAATRHALDVYRGAFKAVGQVNRVNTRQKENKK